MHCESTSILIYYSSIISIVVLPTSLAGDRNDEAGRGPLKIFYPFLSPFLCYVLDILTTVQGDKSGPLNGLLPGKVAIHSPKGRRETSRKEDLDTNAGPSLRRYQVSSSQYRRQAHFQSPIKEDNLYSSSFPHSNSYHLQILVLYSISPHLLQQQSTSPKTLQASTYHLTPRNYPRHQSQHNIREEDACHRSHRRACIDHKGHNH